MYDELSATRPTVLGHRDGALPTLPTGTEEKSIHVNFLPSVLATNNALLHDGYHSVLNFGLISHMFVLYFQLSRMPLVVRGSVLFVQLQDLPICFF